jgi:hypothetical protein
MARLGFGTPVNGALRSLPSVGRGSWSNTGKGNSKNNGKGKGAGNGELLI